MTPVFWTSLILIIMIIYVLFFSWRIETKESFTTYQTEPLKYISTGSTPLGFNQINYYRLPYEYPRTFYKSYPIPSMQYTMLL